MNYQQQSEYVQSLSLAEGERQTLDCPSCGKRQKFTVTKSSSKLIWNCYSASCSVKGFYQCRRSADDLRKHLARTTEKPAAKQLKPIPAITGDPDNYPSVVKYLQSVNSYEAYVRSMIRIRYAPAENRVLFYTKDHRGAVGRHLGTHPAKWWSYGDCSAGVHVGCSDHAVLVEDSPSACAVSQVKNYTGVALLGTKLTAPIKKSLNKYKKVTIVLDKDASNSAINMAHGLVIPTKVRFTNCDLKNLTTTEISKLLT